MKMVSVIIPCHNYEKYLLECVSSVLCCTYDNLEIIVVHDGCSLPITPLGVYRSLIMKNSGVSAARNAGLRMARGEYVWFLDADDMATQNSIKRRVDMLERKPELGAAHGLSKKINVERRNYDWGFRKCWERLIELETYSRPMNNGTLMWRREVFERYGGFYEPLRSKEDKEMTYRLGIHRNSPFDELVKTRRVEDMVYIYRRHPESKHKQRMADKKWSAETDKIFDRRIRRLQKEGITRENTEFPI